MTRITILAIGIFLSQLCNAASKTLDVRIGAYTTKESSSEFEAKPLKGYGKLEIFYSGDKLEGCIVDWVGLDGLFNKSTKEWEYDFDSWYASTDLNSESEKLTCLASDRTVDVAYTNLKMSCKFILGYDEHKVGPDMTTSFAGQCVQSHIGVKQTYQVTTKFQPVTEPLGVYHDVKLNGSLRLPAYQSLNSDQH